MKPSRYLIDCPCGRHHEPHEPQIACACGRLLVVEWRAEIEPEPVARTITERYESA